MLAKSDKAKPRVHGPNLDLPVIAPRRNGLSVRCVCQRVHIKEMTLLFEDIRLRLPFPYEKLAERACTKGKPLSRGRDRNRGDFLL